MAGGKPHASNPRDVHQRKERHDVLRREEKQEGKRSRRLTGGELAGHLEHELRARGLDVRVYAEGPQGTTPERLGEAELLPLLRSCCHDIPISEVDLSVLAYRLANSPLRIERSS